MFADSSGVQELKPQTRYDSHLHLVRGHYTALTGKGTVILQWDNTYSTIRSKTLCYRIRVAADINEVYHLTLKYSNREHMNLTCFL